MKKAFFLIAIVIVAVGLGYAGYRLYQSAGGIGPVLLPVSENAAEEVIANASPFQIPSGFSLSVFSKDVPGARVMTYDPAGTLLVSLTSKNKVVALPDSDGNGADEVITVLDGLSHPHGMMFYQDKLYVAEEQRVVGYDYDATAHTASNPKKLLDLPSGGRHTTRTLMMLPYPQETTVLISVGSSCDVCNEADPNTRAAILAYDFTTGQISTYATGLRNAVFLATQPVDGSTWATEMGRDHLGNDLPPDEINIVSPGKDFGWPICYGQNIHDTTFDKNQYIRDPCADKQPSHIDLPAHVAPLGLAFIPEEGWPEDWWYDLLVAEHGSWNSTTPVGYKIARLKLDAQGNYSGTEDFMTGFLQGALAAGRPVDILVQPGGTVYVSDDKAGVIYRLNRLVDPAGL